MVGGGVVGDGGAGQFLEGVGGRAAGGWFLVVHRGVDLAGGAVRALHHLVAEHDPGADVAPDGEVGEVRDAPGGTGRLLADRGQVDVVVHQHR